MTRKPRIGEASGAAVGGAAPWLEVWADTEEAATWGLTSPTARGSASLWLMDTDGDGGVSLEEVQTFHARVFKLVDADADGKLTHDEVRSFFRSSSE